MYSTVRNAIRMILPTTAVLISLGTMLFGDQSTAPIPGRQPEDQQIATLHHEIRDLRTQLDSVSARVNVVFSISGAILTIFLGPLANKAVNRVFGAARDASEGPAKKAAERRRRSPHPSAA